MKTFAVSILYLCAFLSNGLSESRIEELISRGNVNIKDIRGRSPLFLAADRGEFNVVKTLLENGADVNAENNEIWTPLHVSCKNGHTAVVKLLLEKGANVNARNKLDHTPLHVAAYYGRTDIARALIEYKADVNAQDNVKLTPLHLVSQNDDDHIKIRLSFNITDGQAWFDANSDTCDGSPRDSPNSNLCDTYVLIKVDGIQVYRTKEEDNKDRPIFNEIFETELIRRNSIITFEMWDSDEGYSDNDIMTTWTGTAEYYLNCHLLLGDITDGSHRNSLSVSTEMISPSQTEEVQLSFNITDGQAWFDTNSDTCDSPANDIPNSCDTFVLIKIDGEQVYETKEEDNKDNPIFNEIFETGLINKDSIITFEMWDSDVGYSDNDLIHAWSGNAEYYLNRHVLEGNITDGTHRNSLSVSTKLLNRKKLEGKAEEKQKVAELLLESGANVNAQDSNSRTPLHEAAISGQIEVARILRSYGAIVDATNNDKWTPLFEACFRGRFEMAKLLLEYGADVNFKNSNLETPLHLAVRSGNGDLMKLLFQHGARRYAENKDGISALDIARQTVNARINDLFEQAKVQNIQNACQYHSTDYIHNGELAKDGEFPWMAALGYISETNYRVTFDCGGTIITNLFILTAAHCVKLRQPSIVRMGKRSLIDENDEDETRTVNRHIREIIPHPDHNSRTKRNDIALLRLKRTIPFSDNVKPACLQTPLRDEPTNVELIVTGYGIISTQSQLRSNDLRKAQLMTMPLSQCNTTLINWGKPRNDPALRDGLVEGQYCAYDPQGRNDSCQGDSGGPLQYFPTKDSAVATVLGIVSFGVGCGSRLPAVYTRVAHYLDWIEPIVWSEL